MAQFERQEVVAIKGGTDISCLVCLFYHLFCMSQYIKLFSAHRQCGYILILSHHLYCLNCYVPACLVVLCASHTLNMTQKQI